MPAKYETTVTLPTNGNLYGEDGPEDIVLRAMTTREEKLLLGSPNSHAFDSIIKACVVEPKNLDIGELIPADSNYLLFRLRIHTYGPDYDIVTNCPNCRARNENTINLEDLPVRELDDSFSEPFIIELPMSGDKLECMLLRKKDLDAVDARSKKIARRSKANVNEISFNYRMGKYIKKINGKEVSWDDAVNYTLDMHGRDSAYFWDQLNKVDIGYDTELEIECDECGEIYNTMMPLSMDFFRPSFG